MCTGFEESEGGVAETAAVSTLPTFKVQARSSVFLSSFSSLLLFAEQDIWHHDHGWLQRSNAAVLYASLGIRSGTRLLCNKMARLAFRSAAAWLLFTSKGSARPNLERLRLAHSFFLSYC